MHPAYYGLLALDIAREREREAARLAQARLATQPEPPLDEAARFAGARHQLARLATTASTWFAAAATRLDGDISDCSSPA